MSYYLVSYENGHILEVYHNRPTMEELQKEANYMQVGIYVIEGEHTGLEAFPDDQKTEENEELENE